MALSDEIRNKGWKKVVQIMKRRGFYSTWCIYIPEKKINAVNFVKVGSGVTLESIVIGFNDNWRVKEVGVSC